MKKNFKNFKNENLGADNRKHFFSRVFNLIFVIVFLFALFILHKFHQIDNVSNSKSNNKSEPLILTSDDIYNSFRNYLYFVKTNKFLDLDPDNIKKKFDQFEKTEFYKVIDGDTIVVLKEDKKKYKIRLIGIDTPESSYNAKLRRDANKSHKDEKLIIKLGLKAKDYTFNLLKDQKILYLEYDLAKIDKYGRILAYVYLSNGYMLNLMLVLNGYAKIYTFQPNVKYVDVFYKAQQFSFSNKLGLYKEGF